MLSSKFCSHRCFDRCNRFEKSIHRNRQINAGQMDVAVIRVVDLKLIKNTTNYILEISHWHRSTHTCCNWISMKGKIQGLYSLSRRTSYDKISRSLEAVRFGVKLLQSLQNLTGTSAAAPPRCLSNFRAIRSLQHPTSQLRDFAGFGGNALSE